MASRNRALPDIAVSRELLLANETAFHQSHIFTLSYMPYAPALWVCPPMQPRPAFGHALVGVLYPLLQREDSVLCGNVAGTPKTWSATARQEVFGDSLAKGVDVLTRGGAGFAHASLK